MNVRQYQYLYSIIGNGSDDSIELMIHCVGYYFGKTYEELNALSANPKKFLKYCNRLNKALVIRKPLFSNFIIETDATKITAGQFLECTKWNESSPIITMHKIAASLLPERTMHSKDAEKILGYNVAPVLSQVEKFNLSFEKLIKQYDYLFKEDNEDVETDIKKKKTHPFIKNFGWIFAAKEVAQHLDITLNDVYKISVIEFLNSLTYLKSKQSYDRMIMKEK